MEYKYLAGWVEQNEAKGLVFQELLSFHDQYALKFLKSRTYLQINLASQNSFCFLTENSELPFSSDNRFNKINTILKNARMSGLRISEKDRIIFIDLQLIGLDNSITEYTLVIELIPRFLNIILTRKNTSYLILDALRKFSLAENHQRQILPNLEYELPGSVYDNKSESLQLPLILNGTGGITLSESRSKGYYRINELFEDLYYEVILENQLMHKNKERQAGIKRLIAKKQKKLKKLRSEFSSAKKELLWKQRADLIKNNFRLIKSGMTEIEVVNYYSDDQEKITIPISAEKTPRENMELYYRKYKKARSGREKINNQIEITCREIEELEQDLNKDPDRSTYFVKDKTAGKTIKAVEKFRSLTVDQDWEIVIGRTSKENDHLTTKVARSNDWWFHTRIYKGTHVILRNWNKKELPERLMILCCRIAAYYSRAKKSSNVPVDYTLVKYVRKPRKSPPGFVVYTDQKTLYVDPLSIREAKAKIETWNRGKRG